MIVVRKISFDTLAADPSFQDLLREYAEESSIDGMPSYNPQENMYRAMEQSGFFHLFGAYDEERLVGFVTMVTTTLPHYGVKAGTIESFYVAKSHRKAGAGMSLLRQAEGFAKEASCQAMLVSAPTGSRLSKIMPHVGYRHTNEIFFRRLG